MIVRRKFYLLALVSMLAACSSDVTGVQPLPLPGQAQQETTRGDEGAPREVNKCAIYRNELCEVR